MILSGDIGGTNTRLAYFEGTTLVSEQKFKSKDYKSLEEIVQLFLKSQKKILNCYFKNVKTSQRTLL